MGLFSFISNAGEKLFGSDDIDENAVLKHITGLGLKLKPFSVVAHQKNKMVSLIGYAETLQEKEKAILAAGNIKGVEKVDDRLKVGAPPARGAATAPGSEAPELDADEMPDSQFYTVKSGDTLSKIAREFYGNANKYPVIFEANKPMLSNPDRIYPGQVLRIPKA